MSALFTSWTTRGLTISNHIVVSPMCQYVAEHGKATEWHVIHLGGLASSGAGVLFIEGTAVEPEGRITPGDLGLWDDVTESALAAAVNAVRRCSRIPVVLQIAHAGRKASSRVPWEGGEMIVVSDGGWVPYAPSALPHKPGETVPHALDGDGMRRVRNAFSDAARRASRLGVWRTGNPRCARLSGARVPLPYRQPTHGSVRRLARKPDAFSARGLRSRARSFPGRAPRRGEGVCSGLGAGGWYLAQTIEYAKELKKRGVDWITTSSAGISPLQKIAVAPGYQLPFAQGVREATGVATMAVGLITEAAQAEDIIANGQADLVALARGMLYDPRWPWHAAAELGATVDAPAPSYWRAPPHRLGGLFRATRYGAR
jgi:2,4-dienoyl-CoA reductase-like NADH-dependent reductase (Old Yellow Enzyme family)